MNKNFFLFVWTNQRRNVGRRFIISDETSIE